VLTRKREASKAQPELQNWTNLFSIISRSTDTCWMMCCSPACFSSNNPIMQTRLHTYVGTREENPTPFHRVVTLSGKRPVSSIQSMDLGSTTPLKPPQGRVDSRVGCNSNSVTRELPRKLRQPEGSYAECVEVIHLMIRVEHG